RVAARVLHLGSDRPHPDQLVERQLVPADLARDLLRCPERVACGAYSFVRFLRVLDTPPAPARLRRDVVSPAALGRRPSSDGSARRSTSERSVPSCPKSRPWATRLPSSDTSRAAKEPGSKVPSMSQYPAATKARLSRSRSTTRRVATD